MGSGKKNLPYRRTLEPLWTEPGTPHAKRSSKFIGGFMGIFWILEDFSGLIIIKNWI